MFRNVPLFVDTEHAGYHVFPGHHLEDKSFAFLTRPWLWPSFIDLTAITLLGTTVAFAMVLFANAHKYAESSFIVNSL